jgi:hypothetical protein
MFRKKFRAVAAVSCSTALPNECLHFEICNLFLDEFWSALEKTVKMAAKQNTKNFNCEICDYSTPMKSRLNHHTNQVHLNIKNFECTQCSNKFSRNSYLKKHIIGVHLKRQDFQCHYCNKAFGQKQNLKTHIDSTHKKIKKYWCDLCDYSSYHGYQLEAHSNAVHLGKKDFRCDICDKAFSQKGDLTMHLNSVHKKLTRCCSRHTGDMCVHLVSKSSCELCNYTLKNNFILKHASKHNAGSDDLVKTDILIKPETYSDSILKLEEDQMPETYSDHKIFEEILVEANEIEIKEEFVADPWAIDIEDKEATVLNL